MTSTSIRHGLASRSETRQPGPAVRIEKSNRLEFWADDQVAVQVNQGSFGDGQAAYLYVVDANGATNSQGFPITFNQATNGDTTAPDTVTALSIDSVTQTSATLTWTAVGDDASSGTATTYDLRYSTSPITIANFPAATQATGEPAPKTSGESESFTVTGLAGGTTYYFALRVADEVPNWSGLSNDSNGTTLPPPDTTPPATPTTLGLSAVTQTSATLTWTSVGDDGNTGTATTYDLRYSPSPITSGNFNSVTAVTGESAPRSAGLPETFTVTGLAPETRYDFALKVADDVPNWSGLSNVPNGTTSPLPDATAPDPVMTLSAASYAPTTVTLIWTAVGDDGNAGTATTYDLRYFSSLPHHRLDLRYGHPSERRVRPACGRRDAARLALRQHGVQVLDRAVDVEGHGTAVAALELVGHDRPPHFQHVRAARRIGEQIHDARRIEPERPAERERLAQRLPVDHQRHVDGELHHSA